MFVRRRYVLINDADDRAFLLSWIVPTANTTLLALIANLTSQIESSQVVLNSTRNALSSASLMNTTTLNGTNITNMLSLVEYVDVSNALSQVSNSNNVSEIRHQDRVLYEYVSRSESHSSRRFFPRRRMFRH